MCGIAGLLGDVDEAPLRLDAMLDAIPHRGPDGRGTLVRPGVAGGMVRLALIDTTPRSQQPIWLDDQVAILLNGEIYNFKSERRRLEARGHRFVTSGDAEVALHAYIDDDRGFLQRLRGMFAIAIFDFRAGHEGVLLARDPFGMKPLYLVRDHDRHGHLRLAFASELGALLAGGVIDGQLSPIAVSTFLRRGYVPQDQCIYRGVELLPAGTAWRWQPQRSDVMRTTFWSPPTAQPVVAPLRDRAVELRSVLEESVKLHAFADAPVGAFLSGGIDSTAIVAMMRHHIADLRTFTLTFPDVKDADEGSLATTSAQHLGVPLQVVEVNTHEAGQAFMPFVAGLDQPSFDGFNTWLVSRAASRQLRGVLSGVGGDEWFSGYPVARRMQQLQQQPWLSSVAKAVKHLPSPSMLTAVRQAGWSSRSSLEAHWWHAHSVFDDAQAHALTGVMPARPPHAEYRGALTLCMDLDVRHYMKDQLLRDADVTSMAHSLELRTPFVDIEVAKFASTLSREERISPGHGPPGSYAASGAKRILIEAMRDVLPPHLVTQPKRGFTLPYRTWMNGPLRDRVYGLQQAASWRRDALRPRALSALAQALSQPKHDAMAFPRLWTLLVLDGFLESRLAANTRFTPFGHR
jgi:asparagine synthase (glutamine-hydrolysing)